MNEADGHRQEARERNSTLLTRSWPAVGGRRRELGSSAVEVVLLFPVILMFLLVAVQLSRLVGLRQVTSEVAASAVAAASHGATDETAKGRAEAAMRIALQRRPDINCTVRWEKQDILREEDQNSLPPVYQLKVFVHCKDGRPSLVGTLIPTESEAAALANTWPADDFWFGQ